MSILVENLTHTYSAGTPFAVEAVSNLSFEVKKGELLGIIGHTGSGKSTLIQHLNGLMLPQQGSVTVDGTKLEGKFNRKAIRSKVGMVFQYPEHQLFEETVLKDICFGPQNLGLEEAEQIERAQWAMQLLGLDFETFAHRSPFELSGGQMRRVAIAGVLAMHPDYLVLDEPAAGLDPGSRKALLELILHLQKETEMGVVMVSHSMDDIAFLCSRVLVMQNGKIASEGDTKTVFSDAAMLQSIGLDVPVMVSVATQLQACGIQTKIDFSIEQMAQNIKQALAEENI